jgi:hypothetical protein
LRGLDSKRSYKLNRAFSLSSVNLNTETFYSKLETDRSKEQQKYVTKFSHRKALVV